MSFFFIFKIKTSLQKNSKKSSWKNCFIPTASLSKNLRRISLSVFQNRRDQCPRLFRIFLNGQPISLDHFYDHFISTHHFHMSSSMKSTWAHPGNHLDPSWKTLPPHESFINRIYQQDIPTNSRRPTCCQSNSRRPTSPITMSSEQTVWTVWTRLNKPV